VPWSAVGVHDGSDGEEDGPVSLPAKRNPVRWGRAVAVGLSRSAVLVGLTATAPLVALAVGFFGCEFAFSWSSKLTSPLALRVLANVGEAAMAAVWAAVAVRIALTLVGRPLGQAARRAAGRWMGLQIEARYRPLPPVTRMTTGYWWNGYEYHRSEREARRRAKLVSSTRDPQRRRDLLWFAAAGVTVLPVAALPLLGLGGGIYVTLQSGLVWYGVAGIVAGLLAAPFAWRILRPVGVRLLGAAPSERLGKRVEELESIRADLTQTQAAEMERIERGLHDGAQARLVALGMSMGAAERLVDTDPVAVKAILAEARASSAAALDELRSLVHGINPPVLAERGLVDAVRVLALDSPVEVTVHSAVPSRAERPVEAAVYFAVAELLANVAKHAHASHVTVDLGYTVQMLTASVTDDGVGGAVAAPGSGLNGVERRMAAFGGHLAIDSPAGGPTRMTVAVPCALS
jgi:signal transduction histidine kinase